MSIEYPETAALLKAQVPQILSRWDARVRAEIPASRTQTKLVLQNNLGPLLGEVSQALHPTGAPIALVEGLTLSQDHGRHRAQLAEYSIDEMFLEYRVLRQTILEVLNENGKMTPAEREVITNALEHAMQNAVTHFAQVHQETERDRVAEALRVAEELQTLYDRERRIAHVLQRPLLLDLPEDAVPGFKVASFYWPASTAAEVGGDFLDSYPLPNGHVAFVVGDASGKGLEAAAYNTHVKELLRAFLREDPWHPDIVLARLNKAVCALLHDVAAVAQETFIVLALLVIDPPSGVGRYVSAGAEPLLAVRANGESGPLGEPALPLGIHDDTHYQESVVHLASGDTGVAFTDGLTEARAGRELFGYERVAAVAQNALSGRSLAAAGAMIVDGARAFGGGQLADDACLLLLQRR